jgi:hypothetical protein
MDALRPRLRRRLRRHLVGLLLALCAVPAGAATVHVEVDLPPMVELPPGVRQVAVVPTGELSRVAAESFTSALQSSFQATCRCSEAELGLAPAAQLVVTLSVTEHLGGLAVGWHLQGPGGWQRAEAWTEHHPAGVALEDAARVSALAAARRLLPRRYAARERIFIVGGAGFREGWRALQLAEWDQAALAWRSELGGAHGGRAAHNLAVAARYAGRPEEAARYVASVSELDEAARERRRRSTTKSGSSPSSPPATSPERMR